MDKMYCIDKAAKLLFLTGNRASSDCNVLPRVGARPLSVRVVAWKGGASPSASTWQRLLSVSAARRRLPSRTQSQVMNVAVLSHQKLQLGNRTCIAHFDFLTVFVFRFMFFLYDYYILTSFWLIWGEEVKCFICSRQMHSHIFSFLGLPNHLHSRLISACFVA
jgi:hypothetical protein